jgi:hypothetical protein
MSVPQEIHFISQIACVECSSLKHMIISANEEDLTAVTPVAILSYTPPSKMAWIVTRINLRTLNPSLYLAGTPAGDFRSDDYDWNGLTNAWITVAGSPLIAENAVVSFALFNKPVLLAFAGGKEIQIIVQRDAASLPTDPFQVQVAVHGYLAPGNALSYIMPNLTSIEQP